MNWILMATVGAVMMLAGAVGCFVPAIPGPVIAYAALLLLYAFGCPPPMSVLVAGAVVLVIVEVIDYVLPSVCARKFKCSGWGVFGCFVGTIVGLFFLPFGILLGPFLGTVAGELIAGKNVPASLRGGFGALLGFVICLGLKLASVGLYTWWYFSSLPNA